jgi:hypothetical protein
VLRFNALSVIIVLFLLSVSTSNCTKIDTSRVGAGLIPEVDNVHTFDTTIYDIISINYDSTKACDTLSKSGDKVFGSTSDLLFGTTTANLFFQAKPSSFPFKYEAKPVDFNDQNLSNNFDSVVLVLHYLRTSGDTNAVQTLNVYEIDPNKPFTTDSSYSTCSDITYGSLLGTKNFNPTALKTDTIKAFRDTGSVNQIRVKLDKNWAATKFLAKDSVASDTDFNKLFRGFAVTGPSGNALNYVDLNDADTKLAFYYHYKRTGLSDSGTVTYFKFTNTSAVANKVLRSHTGAEINTYLHNPPKADSFVYIQTSPGTFATLNIKGLEKLSNRIVHRAVLEMEQYRTGDAQANIFPAPEYLFLEARDTAQGGVYRSIPCDFLVSNSIPDINDFGGVKKTGADANNNPISTYSFVLTRYVQNFITHGRSNMDLRLTAPYLVSRKDYFYDECGLVLAPFAFTMNQVAEGRVKLYNGVNQPRKMRLRIIYSKL